MYRCQQCGRKSDPHEPAFHKVLETRTKTYPYRSNCNKGKPEVLSSYDDPGGQGTEIVREILVCGSCA